MLTLSGLGSTRLVEREFPVLGDKVSLRKGVWIGSHVIRYIDRPEALEFPLVDGYLFCYDPSPDFQSFSDESHRFTNIIILHRKKRAWKPE